MLQVRKHNTAIKCNKITFRKFLYYFYHHNNRITSSTTFPI